MAQSRDPASAVVPAVTAKIASGEKRAHAVPSTPDNRLPAKAARNQAAIVVTRKRAGARLPEQGVAHRDGGHRGKEQRLARHHEVAQRHPQRGDDDGAVAAQPAV